MKGLRSSRCLLWGQNFFFLFSYQETSCSGVSHKARDKTAHEITKKPFVTSHKAAATRCGDLGGFSLVLLLSQAERQSQTRHSATDTTSRSKMQRETLLKSLSAQPTRDLSSCGLMNLLIV